MKLKTLLNEIKNVAIITDNGGGLEITDANGKSIQTLERFGVWMVNSEGAYEVVDADDDLKLLMKKYNVTADHIFNLKTK